MNNSLSAARVEVSNRQYMSDHGAAPRGRGNWAFCDANKYGRYDYLDYVLWFSGSFSDARRQAVKAFAAKGVDRVVVCS
jgi:hypothetical protein